MNFRLAPTGIALLVTTYLAPNPLAAQWTNEEHGSWAGPWDHSDLVCASAGCGKLREFAHAAVIPKGPQEGKVLLFRFERDPIPNTQPVECYPGILQVWLFDPASPGTLIRIEHPTIDANFFCSGHSWDSEGDLLVAGGLADLVVSDHTARFLPDQLGGIPAYPQNMPGSDCIDPPFLPSSQCWTSFFSMTDIRWYPTLLTLLSEPLESIEPECDFSQGSGHLVLGGPPGTGVDDGNDRWELVGPGGSSWDCYMGPPGSSGGTSLVDWEYTLNHSTTPPEPLFDTYPRALQLSETQKFRILVCGDTDTKKGDPPGTQQNTGESWVLEFPYDLNQHDDVWQEWRSGETELDRSYQNAVLLHKLGLAANNKDRVLVFGGGIWQPGDPPTLSHAHTSVEEFDPGANAENGSWIKKAESLVHPRMYSNAVILPTGKIFIEGGEGTATNSYSTTPELYDPGVNRTSDGGTFELRPSNDVSGYGIPTPRTYHHLTVLLPDGRIMVAGGEGHGQANPPAHYTFELYSPPYLHLGRQPLITNVDVGPDGVVDFAESFTVNAKTHNGPVDAVILLRPASLTHHFDPDQRYIELQFTGGGTGPGQKTLSVTALADDLGPEGYYMLFVVDIAPSGDRVPSVAKFVRFIQQ